MINRVFPVLCLLLLVGCDSILESGPRRLRRASVVQTVLVPDSVDAGVPFEVRITTLGVACQEVGETPITVQGQFAQLAPFDWLTINDDSCEDDPGEIFEHVASVTFPNSGAARVVVIGSGPTTLPFDVVVRP